MCGHSGPDGLSRNGQPRGRSDLASLQMIFRQLHLEPEAQRWRDGSMEPPLPQAANSSGRSPLSAP
jgi:hypothetical protein